MKKAVLALAAVAAFTAPALAADMAAKAPMMAAPMAYAPSFTGCYIGGGGGYGLWNQENTTFEDSIRGLPRTQFTDTVTTGGRGWFGTVQGGCDYQFSLGGLGGIVIGAFGDYDFADMDGRKGNPLFGVGREKLSSQWAVGGRVGWVALPSLLVYFSGGYTEAKFDQINYTNLFQAPFGVANGFFQDSRTYQGWFLGAGDEYALSFVPGLFWKTEYRLSRLDTETIAFRDRLNAGLPTGFSDDSKKWVQTVRSELVYRFNWSGVSSAPVAARY
jgi:outer membrane immunogenic protein